MTHTDTHARMHACMHAHTHALLGPHALAHDWNTHARTTHMADIHTTHIIHNTRHARPCEACRLGEEHSPTKSCVVRAGAMVSIARSDVARVMAEATVRRTSGLRFDLCSGVGGKPTTDANDVLLAARWPWMTH